MAYNTYANEINIDSSWEKQICLLWATDRPVYFPSQMFYKNSSCYTISFIFYFVCLEGPISIDCSNVYVRLCHSNIYICVRLYIWYGKYFVRLLRCGLAIIINGGGFHYGNENGKVKYLWVCVCVCICWEKLICHNSKTRSQSIRRRQSSNDGMPNDVCLCCARIDVDQWLGRMAQRIK